MIQKENVIAIILTDIAIYCMEYNSRENVKFKVIPGLSNPADDATVQQAVEEAGHQDVRLTVSQLGNNGEELPAGCSIPEKHTQPCKHKTHTHTHSCNPILPP